MKALEVAAQPGDGLDGGLIEAKLNARKFTFLEFIFDFFFFFFCIIFYVCVHRG